MAIIKEIKYLVFTLPPPYFKSLHIYYTQKRHKLQIQFGYKLYQIRNIFSQSKIQIPLQNAQILHIFFVYDILIIFLKFYNNY